MKNKIRDMSIQQKIAWTYSLLIIAIFICQIIAYNIFISEVIESKANDYIIQNLKQTNSKIETYIDTIRIMSNSITSNEEIRDILIRNNEEAKNTNVQYQIGYEDTQQLIREISKLTLAYDNINSVQIYTPYYSVSYNFAGEYMDFSIEREESEKIKNSRGELLLIPSRFEFVDKYYATNTTIFSAVRKIYDYKIGEELGYVSINIQERALREIIEDVEIGSSGVVQLFDSDGYFISSENPSVIGTRMDQDLLVRINEMGDGGYFIEKKQLIAFQKSEITHWGVITRLSIRDVAGEQDILQATNLVIGFVGILVVLLTSYFLSKQLTKPLLHLFRSMEKVRDGDLSSRVTVKSNDEIGRLSKLYNHMTEEVQTLIKCNYEEQLSKKEAQLQAIQAQINPHFMYNTLDTIYWMLVLEGQDKASELVVSLSEILRYSISSKDGSIVSLDREMRMMEYYKIIQTARFENKLSWYISIPDNIRSLYTPKMVIQPIVENAILHGMDVQKPLLSIAIEAFIEEDSLLIKVTDDGKGMSRDQVVNLLEERNIQESRGHTGFGLPGVNRRIKISFGEKYGLQIESVLDKGTCVKIRLPILYDKDKEDQYENSAG